MPSAVFGLAVASVVPSCAGSQSHDTVIVLAAQAFDAQSSAPDASSAGDGSAASANDAAPNIPPPGPEGVAAGAFGGGPGPGLDAGTDGGHGRRRARGGRADAGTRRVTPPRNTDWERYGVAYNGFGHDGHDPRTGSE